MKKMEKKKKKENEKKWDIKQLSFFKLKGNGVFGDERLIIGFCDFHQCKIRVLTSYGTEMEFGTGGDVIGELIFFSFTEAANHYNLVEPIPQQQQKTIVVQPKKKRKSNSAVCYCTKCLGKPVALRTKKRHERLPYWRANRSGLNFSSSPLHQHEGQSQGVQDIFSFHDEIEDGDGNKEGEEEEEGEGDFDEMEIDDLPDFPPNLSGDLIVVQDRSIIAPSDIAASESANHQVRQAAEKGLGFDSNQDVVDHQGSSQSTSIFEQNVEGEPEMTRAEIEIEIEDDAHDGFDHYRDLDEEEAPERDDEEGDESEDEEFEGGEREDAEDGDEDGDGDESSSQESDQESAGDSP